MPRLAGYADQHFIATFHADIAVDAGQKEHQLPDHGLRHQHAPALRHIGRRPPGQHDPAEVLPQDQPHQQHVVVGQDASRSTPYACRSVEALGNRDLDTTSGWPCRASGHRPAHLIEQPVDRSGNLLYVLGVHWSFFSMPNQGRRRRVNGTSATLKLSARSCVR